AEAGAAGFYDEFLMRMNEFMGVTRQADVLRECVSISREVMAGEYYKALTRCRRLLIYEQGLLADVSTSLPDGGSEH
ncbi:MAG: flagellar biosynthesis repressor FlbT, partial [Alphaproteobacteria bacterium]